MADTIVHTSQYGLLPGLCILFIGGEWWFYESLFCFGSSYCELDLAFFLVKVIISNANWMDVPFPDTAHTLLKPGRDIFLRD